MRSRERRHLQTEACGCWFLSRRTDLRYFSSLENNNDDQAPSMVDPTGVLTDTNFWRYTMGIAYRW